MPQLCVARLCGAGAVDPVDVVAQQLMAGGAAGLAALSWSGLGCGHAALEVFADEHPCALTEWDMPAYRAAVLTALAARHLLVPGVVTASVLGSGFAARLQLGLIVRYVPGVSHVSVCSPSVEPIDLRVVDELDLAGIGLSVSRTPAEAVFGANLIVVTDLGDGDVTPVHLPQGSVLINGTAGELPAALTGGVNQVFVDDLALVDPATRWRSAWPEHSSVHSRQQPYRQRRHRIDGDLRQVLVGGCPGRTSQESVLLVELLSVAREAGRDRPSTPVQPQAGPPAPART